MGVARQAIASLRPKARRKNFWDLAYLFNDFGIGMRFIRKIWWNKPETYWKITRVIPTNSNSGTKKGVAYGIYTYLGKSDGKEVRVRSTTKRDWRYVPREQTIAHWPMWNRKDMDMNHEGYPKEYKEKYYDQVP